MNNSENIKIKAFHLFGLSCNEGEELSLIFYDDKIYIEDLLSKEMLLNIENSEINDIQIFEQEDLDYEFPFFKTLIGYGAFGAAGAVLGGLTGVKSICRKYLCLRTNNNEFVFEINPKDVSLLDKLSG
ncbi:MAG: hypothetical protein K6C94_00120 [Candidatus Gastranaerophilales bacterium]|nr:hypothetical protein [Candidatus Gastranaerophilales bacterium]